MLTRPSGLHSAVRRCRSEWRCLGYTEAVGKPQTMQNRTEKKRVLIFIVAYNAERTIEQVLRRIPSALLEHDTEVLIIDDSSHDQTFEKARGCKHSPFPVTVLHNPVSQGYGGNQKIGFHYAIRRDFDVVALVHGDGKYEPEVLPRLLLPLLNGEADAVCGSRMMRRFDALKGEKLYDQQYVQTYVEGFAPFAESIKDFTPEEMAPICGIPADTLREVARGYARAESAIIFWGMGVSQHTHGTDNARCLIALSLICGQVGRPGTGLHPLRGQNNVQGASDAGLIPMFFPDYESVENPEQIAKYETAWGTTLDPKQGLTVVEIMDAVHRNEITGMYI